jgi:hypothetical protein
LLSDKEICKSESSEHSDKDSTFDEAMKKFEEELKGIDSCDFMNDMFGYNRETKAKSNKTLIPIRKHINDAKNQKSANIRPPLLGFFQKQRTCESKSSLIFSN